MSYSAYFPIAVSMRYDRNNSDGFLDYKENLMERVMGDSLQNKIPSISVKSYDSLAFDYRNFSESLDKSIKLNAIISDGTHLCRETLIHFIKITKDSIKAQSKFGRTLFLVEYRRQNGNNLSEEYKEKIRRFGDAFLSNKFSKIHIVPEFQKGDHIVISLDLSDDFYEVELWDFSLFLWIFKNPEILDEVLNNFDSQHTVKNLMAFLCPKFLTNPDWWDDENPAVALSLYCYERYTPPTLIWTSGQWEIGPCRAATIFQNVHYLLKYIQDIFIPLRGTSLEENSAGLNHCPTIFKSSFKTAFELCVLATEIKPEKSTPFFDALKAENEKAEDIDILINPPGDEDW